VVSFDGSSYHPPSWSSPGLYAEKTAENTAKSASTLATLATYLPYVPVVVVGAVGLAVTWKGLTWLTESRRALP